MESYWRGCKLATQSSDASSRQVNALRLEDQCVHRWYRFVLAYPAHLVREYIEKFDLGNRTQVLDPFCGTGTTLVECKLAGITSVGLEANPVAAFASRVKTDWSPDPGELVRHAREVAALAFDKLEGSGIHDIPMALYGDTTVNAETLRTLEPERAKLLLADSISPLPLHKALTLLDALYELHDGRFYAHEWLAFANTVVQTASNLHFGPEVGVGKKKQDAPVINPWLAAVQEIACDLERVEFLSHAPSRVYPNDARELTRQLEPCSVDAVITSPPYPNEKDYTRTTRLESVLLGFLQSRADLRNLKQHLVRSNTRGIYADDDDDVYVEKFASVQRIADEIEERRLALGKTSGFERLYARATKLYFGGMARHLSELTRVLRPGAQLAYVVGDQSSYLRVMIRTSEILSEIASSLGYDVLGTDLFRTRFATATQEHMREDVLLMRWTGKTRHAED